MVYYSMSEDNYRTLSHDARIAYASTIIVTYSHVNI